MEKFWEWMKEKGYGEIDDKDGCKFVRGSSVNEMYLQVYPTYQMVIGYMIEYLYHRLLDRPDLRYEKFKMSFINSHHHFYKYLEQKIKDLK